MIVMAKMMLYNQEHILFLFFALLFSVNCRQYFCNSVHHCAHCCSTIIIYTTVHVVAVL